MLNSCQEEYDMIPEYNGCDLKIILLGDVRVGKSSLASQFTENKFQENKTTTIGTDLKQRKVEINGQPIQINIWDTAGSHQFRDFHSNYYRDADGVVIVYDSTNLTSFNNVKQFWMKDIADSLVDKKANKLLVGNKCDLLDQKVVSDVVGQEFADSVGLPFIATTATDSQSTENAFFLLVRNIFERVKEEKTRPKIPSIDTAQMASPRRLPIPKAATTACTIS